MTSLIAIMDTFSFLRRKSPLQKCERVHFKNVKNLKLMGEMVKWYSTDGNGKTFEFKAVLYFYTLNILLHL